MSYAPSPMDALVQRARYLCSKNDVPLKNNAWNPCWRVWVELVQKMHLVWPPERVAFSLALGMDERPGVGPATVVQGAIEVFYCDAGGNDTGSETFVFEWFCPLLLKLGAAEHAQEWHIALGHGSLQQQVWLRNLLSEPTLKILSVQAPVWKRSIGQLKHNVTEYWAQSED